MKFAFDYEDTSVFRIEDVKIINSCLTLPNCERYMKTNINLVTTIANEKMQSKFKQFFDTSLPLKAG